MAKKSYEEKKIASLTQRLKTKQPITEYEIMLERQNLLYVKGKKQKGVPEPILTKSCVTTSVDKFKYDACLIQSEYEPSKTEVQLIPHGKGSRASSSVPFDSYEYTHGGHTYTKAVDMAKSIHHRLKE